MPSRTALSSQVRPRSPPRSPPIPAIPVAGVAVIYLVDRDPQIGAVVRLVR